jgi:hypothetical protein
MRSRRLGGADAYIHACAHTHTHAHKLCVAHATRTSILFRSLARSHTLSLSHTRAHTCTHTLTGGVCRPRDGGGDREYAGNPDWNGIDDDHRSIATHRQNQLLIPTPHNPLSTPHTHSESPHLTFQPRRPKLMKRIYDPCYISTRDGHTARTARDIAALAVNNCAGIGGEVSPPLPPSLPSSLAPTHTNTISRTHSHLLPYIHGITRI